MIHTFSFSHEAIVQSNSLVSPAGEDPREEWEGIIWELEHIKERKGGIFLIFFGRQHGLMVRTGTWGTGSVL